MKVDELFRSPPSLLRLSDGGRFFARPFVDSAVFLDSDSPPPDAVADARRAGPRVVVETSAAGRFRNNEAWYALAPTTAKARRASAVTRELQEALCSEPNSTGLRQQGGASG